MRLNKLVALTDSFMFQNADFHVSEMSEGGLGELLPSLWTGDLPSKAQHCSSSGNWNCRESPHLSPTPSESWVLQDGSVSGYGGADLVDGNDGPPYNGGNLCVVFDSSQLECEVPVHVRVCDCCGLHQAQNLGVLVWSLHAF